MLCALKRKHLSCLNNKCKEREGKGKGRNGEKLEEKKKEVSEFFSGTILIQLFYFLFNRFIPNYFVDFPEYVK